MVKLLKYAVVICLFGMLTMSVVYGSLQTPFYDPETQIENFSYINQQLLESSRYTQSDAVDQAVLDNYLDNYQLSYTEAQLDQLGFEQIFENADLNVYFEKDSFSIIVENKETGYFWSSRPEFQGLSGVREDNTAARNLMNSGLWVEYIRKNNVSSSNIVRASLYTMAEASYLTDGAMTAEQNDPIHPYLLSAGSYAKRRVETTIKSRSANEVIVGIDLKLINTSFDVHLTLDGNQIGVLIPNESILEEDENFRLIGITVFPYFGAAREDAFPGYFLIPDGIGALVRTNERHNTSFQARFYGSDAGYSFNTLPELSVPMFGIVHEPNANAFYVRVDEGSETSQLRAQFWGTGTRYHRINARFGIRTIFRNVINKAGDGSDAIREEITASNFRLSYEFLSHDKASYVGMGVNYREHLIETGVLTDNEKNNNNDIPLHLSYIMSDREPSFFGTSRLEMTSATDVLNSYEAFKEAGIVNQQVSLYGWSNDGFFYRAPYRTRISDRNDFESMVEAIKADDNTVYLDNDYVMSSELSRRVGYNRDVARNVSRLKMTFNRRMLNGRLIEMYMLAPDRSLALAQSDVSDINGLGVSGLSMNALGSTLFSHYDNGVLERTDAISTYQEIAGLYDSVLLSMPNSYLYGRLDGYMNMAITNSQYDYYTDLVPLLPIILKGSISYYTPYLNFNALAEDRLLTMVDFAVNPSYVLTEKPTYEMRFTMANRFYTTARSDYEAEIIEVYAYLNAALRHVIGASIVNREVIETGLVLVTYDNGVSIYVNYNYQAKVHDTHTIDARNYKVVTS
ncbi:MAG: DUF5696 domain-containing protein [Acholeplasmataceae bacterium]